MPTVFQDERRKFTNLVHVLQASVSKYGPRPLFGVLGANGVQWTSFQEFQTLVDQFRAGLASLGVKSGDAVAVISNNRLEWAVGSHACFGLGAAYVPMYEAQLDKEWEYILADSDAVICLAASPAIQKRVEAMRSALPKLRHVVSFDSVPDDVLSYAGLLARGKAQPVQVSIPDGEDVASLIYTSGTTGKPKGVVLTHKNLSSVVNSMLEIVDIGSDDRGIAFLPWAHVFGGCIELNLAICTGAGTAICGDATKLGEYLSQVKPTVLFAVPRVWNKIHAGVQNLMMEKPPAIQWIYNTALSAKQKLRTGKPVSLREKIAIKAADKIIFPKILEKFGGNLRFAVSGAAALPRAVAEFMESLGIQVHEGYGLTETCGSATAQPKDAVRLGSVGKAVPGVTIVLDKTVAGATDDEGEVILYGENIMRGYHKRKGDTSDALTPDGGLRTGDLGRLDADGYLYITGRAKELYKLENGKYVAPVPLEQELELSAYISQAIVTGENRPHNVALIVPDFVALEKWAKAQSIEADRDGLLSHSKVLSLLEAEVEKCNQGFKGYERVVDFLVDSEELTAQNGMLTQTLKPKRRSIMSKYGRDLEALYPRLQSERPAPRASYIRELRPDQAAVKSA
jgi:long-chain acyl-CoA synthetase